MIRFGPSGNELAFYERGNKKTEQAAKYISDMGLTAYEYSFGKGVRITPEKAQSLKEAFLPYDIAFSVHAPYYINFANPDPEMVQKSFGYLIASAQAAKAMGANRVIFHPATQGKATREEAVNRTKENLSKFVEIATETGIDDVIFCPETMGKLGQIGTVEEIIEFCQISNLFVPCVDFGHVNARQQGSLKTADDFSRILQALIDGLGKDRVQNFHVHFSKIMYGAKGEIKHLTFEDETYGPEFAPLAQALKTHGLTPVIISESDGKQAEEAKIMQDIYAGN